MNKAKKNKELVLKVTEDDYKQGLAKGWTDDDMLKPGQYTFKPIPRRHLLTPEQTSLRNCKVRITMFIDADVLQHFKARAAEPNAAPYQTQINQALREAMERHTDRLATSTASDPLSVFQDKRFIAKLNKHIDARVKSKQHQ